MSYLPNLLSPAMGTTMPHSESCRIHPTAIISPAAVLADDVEVGPLVIIEGPVCIGSGSVLRPRAHLCGPLTMGSNNIVYGGAILGECPQHLHYQGEQTSLEIGNGNIFREYVTVHRGTSHTGLTRIGNNN